MNASMVRVLSALLACAGSNPRQGTQQMGTAPTSGFLRGRLVIEYRMSLDRSSEADPAGSLGEEEPTLGGRP